MDQDVNADTNLEGSSSVEDNGSSTTNDVTHESQDSGSSVDYKQRYADSTREAQRLSEENKRLAEEREELSKYAEVGQNFVTKYNSDPSFKNAVESALQKKEAGEELTTKEQGIVDQANQATGATLSPEDQAFLQRKKAEEQTTMYQKEREFASLIEEVEKEDKSHIDKYTEVVGVDPATGRKIEVNPLRRAIGSLAEYYQKSQGLDQKQAFTTARDLLIRPEKFMEESKLEGMMQGLQTNQVGVSMFQAKGASNRNENPGSLTKEDNQMIEKFGGLIDPEVMKSIKKRDAQTN